MLNNKNIQIGYLDSCNKTTVKRLTQETLENLMRSEHVMTIMAKIREETDEEKKSELKRQLPAIQFCCQMPEDGKRPTLQTAIPSGFCMHDWDHLPMDPAIFYFENIAGSEENLGIVFAHVTPRGHGIRLVTTMKDGEQIPQCQQRFATLFNMQQYADISVKDITRLSFLPDEPSVLYRGYERLFQQKALSPAPLPLKGEGVETSDNSSAQTDRSSQSALPSKEDLGGPSIASSFTYDGIKYSAIIEALLARIATQGEPREGERNEDLFLLVRELRHICEYNFNKVYMLVAPYFKTLTDAEIRRTISNAIATNGRTMTPVMRGVLDELKNQNFEVSRDTDDMKLPKLPKVSPVEEMIISKYPKHLRSQVFLAALPIWGIYGTHLHFDYLDGRENSLSFMTAVVGKSGSGKAYAADLYDKMTKRFRIEDAIERQKADEYLAQYNKAGEGTEKPDDPRPRVRLYSDDITTCQMLEYLDNLQGEHGFQFTEEVTRLEKVKHTIHSNNDDLYCKAFDNAIGGKESKSKQTRNIRIKIYLNTLFCGTPGAMHKFYNNPEGGLNNRVIFTFMPKIRIKGFPRYEKFTEADQKMFDETCDRLWQAGQDGKKLELPWLEKTVLNIKAKWDKEDDENPDEVWYDLGKRSLIVAFRVGVLQWQLRGCPEDKKELSEISRVVRWTAETMRQSVYAFSGKDYEEIAETDNAYQEKTVPRITKNKKLFSLLPDDFTVQDVIALRVKNGDSANVRMVLSRWMQDGSIIQSELKGHYHKLKSLTA